MSRGRRHNQSYQVCWRSVQGVQSYGGSNFGLLHRNGLSPIRLCYMWYQVLHWFITTYVTSGGFLKKWPSLIVSRTSFRLF